MSQNRLNTIRKIILSVSGITILAIAFSLSRKIVDGNPPPRRQAEKTVKEVYYSEVLNGPYNVQIPSNGLLQAYQRIKITSRVQGVMNTIKPLFKPGQA